MNPTSATSAPTWHPWGVALAAAFAAGLASVLPGMASLLQYDRGLIAHGEVWRLLTSHWTHWNGQHLGWDLVAFCVLLLFSMRINRSRTVMVVLAASVLIPAAVWLFLPGMNCYRGLSGLGSALLTFVGLSAMKASRARRDLSTHRLVLLTLIGFAMKIAFELITGRTLFVQSMGPGIVGVPLAHLVGGAVGLIFGLGWVQTARVPRLSPFRRV